MAPKLTTHMSARNMLSAARTRLLRLAIPLTVLALATLAFHPSSAKNERVLAALESTPVFRFPVVPGAVISGYFDHNPRSGQVTFYNGRHNLTSSYGFYFSCSTPSMYDFVGCEDSVSGEPACSNSRELWYDGHKGIDYEYSSNWHTGAACDPGRFSGITQSVYAPAAGKVMFAGYDAGRPGNGWHIRIKHDLNGNGDYNDDNIRSNFLHFTANALAVQTNDIVSEGQYLGLGGSTGYSSSPHLHFEIQRSSDDFSTTVWSVDPYGWSGAGSDPWPYQNVNLWRRNTNLPYRFQIPYITNVYGDGCSGCGELLDNGGFEDGQFAWAEVGVDIITSRSDEHLTVSPYSGDWLAWLGGRNNAADSVYQDFRVSAGSVSARLRYHVRMGTAESGGVYDWMSVRLRTSDGSLLQDLDYIDNNFTYSNQWVLREISIPGLAAYQNQSLRISFEASTDESQVTNFYLDDVSLVSAQ